MDNLSGIKKLCVKAISDFKLIDNADSILIGLSGGKDSMTLCNILSELKEYYNISIIAVHINGSYDTQQKPIPKDITSFLDNINVPYYEEIIDIPENEPLPLNCNRCSYNRRKTLFLAANKYNCNKIALAHNKDDIIETLLINIMNSGNTSSFPAKREYFNNKFTLIRPFYYIPANAIKSYVTNHSIPIYKNPCPLAYNSGRTIAREIIQTANKKYPDARNNILKLIDK